MVCTHLKSCPLFAVFSCRGSLSLWKTFYCEGDFTRCERLKLAQQGEKVPDNMLPNGKRLNVPLDRLRT